MDVAFGEGGHRPWLGGGDDQFLNKIGLGHD
jgi:hypothetical protein